MEKHTNSKSARDITVRILLLGDQNVGKTTLVIKATFNIFKQIVSTTYNVHVTNTTLDKIYRLNNSKAGSCYDHGIVLQPKLEIRDIGGIKMYNPSFDPSFYFTQSLAAIVVIDVTKESTFNCAKQWIESLNNHIVNYDYGCDDYHYPIALCFNKMDL